MFIKTIVKTDTKTKKRYEYLRLSESYRVGKLSRHRTILNLGEVPFLNSPERKKSFADRFEAILNGENTLFSSSGTEMDSLLEKFHKKYREQNILPNKIDKTEKGSELEEVEKEDWEEVNLNSLETEEVKEIGAEWICYQAIEQLDFKKCLLEAGLSERETKIALMHIISKAVYPASERRTAEWIRDNSAVSELFGLESGSINRHHLYAASKNLYAKKDIIEKHLSKKTNELFDIEDKIILFDLTNTYFEGRKIDSDLAQFGRSKEKRADAKLITLALVTNAEGFVKHSKIFKGNIADCKTLEDIVKELSGDTSLSGRKPMVVIDAGIATKENLDMLKSSGYDYLCVTRSKLKEYTVADANAVISLKDKNDNPIEVKFVKPEVKKEEDASDDTFLYVRSEMKAKKEASMETRFSEKMEEELKALEEGLGKKGATKKIDKVCERLGRIKERYAYAAKFYEISVEEENGIAVALKWSKKELKINDYQGVYFLRCSINNLKEKDLWKIYNSLTEIEATFRTLKSDLSLRPVHHQNDVDSEAHLFLGVLAYSVVATLRYQLKQKGNHDCWQTIVRKMNTQKRVLMTMKNRKKEKISMITCSKPILAASLIYEMLGYKKMPFTRKKFVLPER